METETIRIIDHGITLTKDHITTIKILDPEITLGIEATTIQTDRETILNHHIEKMLKI